MERYMIIVIDTDVTVNQLQDGTVAVTRPTILGKVATHVINSPYSAVAVATFLSGKLGYTPRSSQLIQDIFPDMSDEDREFLLSGITPTAWAAMFSKEDA